MPSRLIVDFIGMCVFIQPPPAEGQNDTQYVDRVGLLREPRHVHMISYREGAVAAATDQHCPVPDLTVLRGLLPGRYFFGTPPPPPSEQVPVPLQPRSAAIHECDPGPNAARLPNLEYVAGVMAKSEPHVDNAMAVLLTLPGGDLYPQPPTDPHAESNWVFPNHAQVHLTDRTRLEVDIVRTDILYLSRAGQSVAQSISIPVEGGAFRLVIAAIDQDLGTRETKPTNGYVLEEFQLFYALTDEFGPSPYFLRGPADPDSPICPQIRVMPKPRPKMPAL